jgi:hypothetical protein
LRPRSLRCWLVGKIIQRFEELRTNPGRQAEACGVLCLAANLTAAHRRPNPVARAVDALLPWQAKIDGLGCTVESFMLKTQSHSRR